MSTTTLAHAERRIQKFVLKPLSLFLILAIVVSLYRQLWWTAVAFVLFQMYLGHIGSQLTIHHGKSFKELSQGITPELPAVAANDMLSDEELLLIATTLLRLPPIFAGIATIFSIANGFGYWSIPIALGSWIFARFLFALLMPVIASPTSFLLQRREK